MRTRMICLAAIAAVLGVSAGQALSAGGRKSGKTSARNKPKVVAMTVVPADEPRPALKFSLLPSLLDRRPGNAATLYYLAVHAMPKYDRDTIQGWLGMPLQTLRKQQEQKKIEAMLHKNRAALRQIQLATRRETCDWGLPIRTEGYNVHLPSLSKFRNLAKILAVRARLRIAQGRVDEAIETLQTGFSMARQVAEGTLLIGDLVGTAISAIMLERVQELVQAPGSPNLYWALSGMPRPLFSPREAMEYEVSALYLAFPRLRKPAVEESSPADWRRSAGEYAKLMSVVRGEPVGGSYRLLSTAYVLTLYPQAKRRLIAKGKAAKQVEAMPAQQVVAIVALEQYDRWRDELLKWFSLPYWQAQQHLTKAAAAFRKWQRTDGAMNPFTALLPSLTKAYLISARGNRKIAALRCIEAVRMHVARTGKLPDTLSGVTRAPTPLNPVTGKPFGYKAVARTFTLEALDAPYSPPRVTVRYEVTFPK